MTTHLKIEGMTCKMCVGHVRRAIERIEGVSSASVDLESTLATIEHENADIPAIVAALDEEGYKATLTS